MHMSCAQNLISTFLLLGLWLFNCDCNFRINPDLRYTIYCTALRTGGEKEWDFVYSQYKQAVVASEQDNLLRALSCSEVPWILQRSV
jgi:aminopeptidase N